MVPAAVCQVWGGPRQRCRWPPGKAGDAGQAGQGEGEASVVGQTAALHLHMRVGTAEDGQQFRESAVSTLLVAPHEGRSGWESVEASSKFDLYWRTNRSA